MTNPQLSHAPGRRARKTVVIILSVLTVLGGVWAGVRAQTPTKSAREATPRYAPACCGYPFPREFDAEIADGDVHRVLFEDDHAMLMEVTNAPQLDVRYHGHPYISVFAHDTGPNPPNPAAAKAPFKTGPLDPESPYNDMGSGVAPPPQGLKWPTCETAAPQAPHKPYNGGINTGHFYRIEFLRVEAEDFHAHWKEWYPWMTEPVKPVKDLVPGPALGPNLSEEWPYPAPYDSIKVAPNNYRLLYEDQKVRLVEVTIRPGETTPMHGHPYPAVLSFNSISGNPADVTEKFLDPVSKFNGQGAGHGAAPKVLNLKSPTCSTMNVQAPHAVHNAGKAPVHYYRLDYKRIDGDGITANWKKWYPWTQYLKYMR